MELLHDPAELRADVAKARALAVELGCYEPAVEELSRHAIEAYAASVERAITQEQERRAAAAMQQAEAERQQREAEAEQRRIEAERRRIEAEQRRIRAKQRRNRAKQRRIETERREPEYEDSRYCCKICRKGKACGNSCISASKVCHKGPGCACDAW